MENSIIDYNEPSVLDLSIEQNTRILRQWVSRPEDLLIIFEILREIATSGEDPEGSIDRLFLLHGDDAVERQRDWEVIRCDLPTLIADIEPIIEEYEQSVAAGDLEHAHQLQSLILMQMSAIGPRPALYAAKIDAYWRWRETQGGQKPLFYAGILKEREEQDSDADEGPKSYAPTEKQQSFLQSKARPKPYDIEKRKWFGAMIKARSDLRAAILDTEAGQELLHDALQHVHCRDRGWGLRATVDLGTIDPAKKDERESAVRSKLPGVVRRLESQLTLRREIVAEIVNRGSFLETTERWERVEQSRRTMLRKVSGRNVHLDHLLPAVSDLQEGAVLLTELEEDYALYIRLISELEDLSQLKNKQYLDGMKAFVRRWGGEHANKRHASVIANLLQSFKKICLEGPEALSDLTLHLRSKKEAAREQLLEIISMHRDRPSGIKSTAERLTDASDAYAKYRDQLVAENRGLIGHIIKHRLGAEFNENDDLFLDGLTYLHRAADRYDIKHGVKFDSFAGDMIYYGLLSEFRRRQEADVFAMPVDVEQFASTGYVSGAGAYVALSPQY